MTLNEAEETETEIGIAIERAFGNRPLYRVRNECGGVSVTLEREDIRELAEAAGFDVETC